MIHFVREKKIDRSASDLYDLVNDTDNYQMFVPFCKESRVLSSDGNEKVCELIFSKGPLSRQLITRNVLKPKERIEVYLHKGDFSHLQGIWHFDKDNDSCLVKAEFEYAFKDPVIEYVFGPLFNNITEQMIEIFAQRANAVLR